MKIYELINPVEVYERILENKPYGKNLKPYTKKVIQFTINYFEGEEKYEICIFLKKFIENKYKHNENYINL